MRYHSKEFHGIPVFDSKDYDQFWEMAKRGEAVPADVALILFDYIKLVEMLYETDPRKAIK